MHRSMLTCVGIMLLTSGCILPAPSDPVSPSLVQPRGGYRLTSSGHLKITPWGRCDAVDVVAIRLETSGDDAKVIGHWSIRRRPSAPPFQQLIYGHAPPGFKQSRARGVSPNSPRATYAWVYLNPGPRQTVDFVDLKALRSQQAAHPSSHEWYVNKHGWLTKEQFSQVAKADRPVEPLCES